MGRSKQSGSGDRSINKSEAIREVIGQRPDADTKTVVSILADKGIKVAPTLVYYIKSKNKQAKRKQRREQAAETSRTTGASNPVELVIKVKELAGLAGGMRMLKRLVDVLAE